MQQINNIFRLKQVVKSSGLSRSSIYVRMKKKDFPRSIKLGERSVGWLESDINDWIASRVQATDTLAAGGHNG